MVEVIGINGDKWGRKPIEMINRAAELYKRCIERYDLDPQAIIVQSDTLARTVYSAGIGAGSRDLEEALARGGYPNVKVDASYMAEGRGIERDIKEHFDDDEVEHLHFCNGWGDGYYERNRGWEVAYTLTKK